MQREQQDKLMDEMFSPVSGRIMPASIEERLELYTQRNKLEDEGKAYRIIRQKFLNYREFFCKITAGKKELLESYALCYSTLPRKRAQGRIEFSIDDVHFMNREEIKFITLSYFNTFFKTSYQNITELIFNPPSIEEELLLRKKISESTYDLSPIFVVEAIPQTKLTVSLDVKIYEDTREKLIVL